MSALGTFLANLRAAPRRFAATMFRGGAPTTDRTRSTFVFGNVFLHLHPVRTHRWSLRWATTWGLGTAAFAAFLITLVTGELLMACAIGTGLPMRVLPPRKMPSAA